MVGAWLCFTGSAHGAHNHLCFEESVVGSGKVWEELDVREHPAEALCCVCAALVHLCSLTHHC